MTVDALERRASRVARWVAFGSTLLVGIYVGLRLRAVQPAWRSTARAVCAVAVVTWYVLTFRIVKRVTLEWLK